MSSSPSQTGAHRRHDVVITADILTPYVSARSKKSPNGKVLHINTDGTTPAIASVAACAPPRYGMCCSSNPAACARRRP